MTRRKRKRDSPTLIWFTAQLSIRPLLLFTFLWLVSWTEIMSVRKTFLTKMFPEVARVQKVHLQNVETKRYDLLLVLLLDQYQGNSACLFFNVYTCRVILLELYNTIYYNCNLPISSLQISEVHIETDKH